MSTSHKATLEVKTRKKGLITVPLKKGKWGENAYQRVYHGVLTFDETAEIGYADIEKGDELALTVIDENNHTRVFYFFVDIVTLNFERDPKTGKTIFSEITIDGISYPSILSRNVIEGTFEFENGFGDLVKRFGEKYGFSIQRVKLMKKKGVIFFKQMPILEAIRRMAVIENWCFYFIDKEIIFEPCQPPKDSGIVITGDEINKGTYSKG